jgi:hypothetical protein
METPVAVISSELSVLLKSGLVQMRPGVRWSHFNLSPRHQELVLNILEHFEPDLLLHPVLVRDQERIKLLGDALCAPQPSNISLRVRSTS